ncbi:hypothetical protein GS429_21605 [Natronorubrum sp. JWXQ-INN-674]|uniref:Polymer-forming cytoskeletal protein n=1 Tax=Natronorubrum halalkaliphilum TaxID=2691917 RepID=A0A6B0VTY2_9EURY|nr:polymer-forming cytoskeletal protein [Natronorubrum halalkaliphilum]MXV64623.1 hypothetical protein [Natronorubrum halalkaliphilum]
MTRTLTVAALGLILLGATVMAGPTFGFATIGADRGVSVGTAPDSSAYLGLEDRSSSASIGTPDDTTVAYTVTDNLGGVDRSDIDVSVVQITDDSNQAVATSSLAATVESGSEPGTFDVRLACGAGETLDGTYSVQLHIVASSASSSVDVTRETSTQISIDCTEVSDEPRDITEDEDGDVTTGGSVSVDNNVNVGGNITSGGSVSVANNANVEGTIIAQGDVTISNNAIGGDIIAGGNVEIRNNAEINGNITACGSVTVRNNADVTGTISEYQTDIPEVQC